jgi:hypothetical protein
MGCAILRSAQQLNQYFCQSKRLCKIRGETGNYRKRKDLCYPILHTCSLNMAEQKIRHIKSYFFYTMPYQTYPHFLTQGDSGGAAYIRGQDGNLEVVGVNSMMTPASAKQLFDMLVTQNQRAKPSRSASIYVRVSQLNPWIHFMIKELSRL